MEEDLPSTMENRVNVEGHPLPSTPNTTGLTWNKANSLFFNTGDLSPPATVGMFLSLVAKGANSASSNKPMSPDCALLIKRHCTINQLSIQSPRKKIFKNAHVHCELQSPSGLLLARKQLSFLPPPNSTATQDKNKAHPRWAPQLQQPLLSKILKRLKPSLQPIIPSFTRGHQNQMPATFQKELPTRSCRAHLEVTIGDHLEEGIGQCCALKVNIVGNCAGGGDGTSKQRGVSPQDVLVLNSVMKDHPKLKPKAMAGEVLKALVQEDNPSVSSPELSRFVNVLIKSYVEKEYFNVWYVGSSGIAGCIPQNQANKGATLELKGTSKFDGLCAIGKNIGSMLTKELPKAIYIIFLEQTSLCFTYPILNHNCIFNKKSNFYIEFSQYCSLVDNQIDGQCVNEGLSTPTWYTNSKSSLGKMATTSRVETYEKSLADTNCESFGHTQWHLYIKLVHSLCKVTCSKTGVSSDGYVKPFYVGSCVTYLENMWCVHAAYLQYRETPVVKQMLIMVPNSRPRRAKHGRRVENQGEFLNLLNQTGGANMYNASKCLINNGVKNNFMKSIANNPAISTLVFMFNVRQRNQAFVDKHLYLVKDTFKHSSDLVDVAMAMPEATKHPSQFQFQSQSPSESKGFEENSYKKVSLDNDSTHTGIQQQELTSIFQYAEQFNPTVPCGEIREEALPRIHSACLYDVCPDKDKDIPEIPPNIAKGNAKLLVMADMNSKRTSFGSYLSILCHLQQITLEVDFTSLMDSRARSDNIKDV
eukprot:jgi/Psemu1/38008/gm1.38008_g